MGICLNDVVIGTCDADDLEQAIFLLHESARTHFFHGVELKQQALFLEANTHQCAIELQQQGFQYFAAKCTDKLVGFVSISPLGHIHQLFVATSNQKSGVGRLLLQKAIGSVDLIKAKHRVTVAASFNSAQFYVKNGFEFIDDKKYWHGVAYYPMALQLK
ncbi:GNAT family N-acetyltransferase [Chitinibacter sp. SCUT-21]|uniref:GNAT family N-acetyltransferase n=1 Tax=Chitinibacter sp. SCUT-21 TaxID=2970891 RepID=UPI0035A623B1